MRRYTRGVSSSPSSSVEGGFARPRGRSIQCSDILCKKIRPAVTNGVKPTGGSAMMKRVLLMSILVLNIWALGAGKSIPHVQETGRGRAVIFLPGLGCAGAVWQATAAELAEAVRRQYDGMTRCTVAISHEARHFIMYDDPDWLNGQLKDFLVK
jgi:hypothetical protein